jgi:protein gp37
MNEQKPPNGIEWTRLPGRKGYTLNPIAGCGHGCRWRMPGGKVVQCYAKSVAEGPFAFHYPGGFENITFHPERLDEIKGLKKPSGIFIDSMSDLFGVGVPAEWTSHVLNHVALYPQHVFFSLTKNAPQLVKFKMPSNLWVGISAPATFMFGKELSFMQQVRWFETSLGYLAQCDSKTKWVSLEPLSIDVSEALDQFRSYLSWAVIGAGSDGRRYYQPDEQTLCNVRDVLHPLPIFFKGNMSKELAMEVFGRWPNDFPKEEVLCSA